MQAGRQVDSPQVVEVELESDYLDQVLALHRGAKRYLGFLPDEGFKDRAAGGTLLAAVRNDRVLGYVLFDLPGNRVKLVHLCVDPASRNGGVARLLVDEVSLRHRDRLGIQLKCRRDFPANDFWPKVGFLPVGDKRGRSQEGHLLTVWLRDHGHPDLFTELTEEREIAALDQVVLVDLVGGNRDGELSRNLLDTWVQDMVELCVTDQALIESNECNDPELRAKLMRQARELRHLRGSADCENSLVERVAGLAPHAGDGDHRHVAFAITGGAQHLLTRDGDLLRAADAISSELGVSVVRPEQLIADLDRIRRHGLYEPAALQGTELLEVRLSADQQEAFTGALLNHGAGERAYTFRSLVRAALADPSAQDVVSIEERSGRILAGFVRQQDEDKLRIGLLRSSGLDSRSRAIARQIVFAQRAKAAKLGRSQVVVDDPHLSPSLLAALEAESFVRTDEGWVCEIRLGVHPAVTGERGRAAAQERTCWPVKLTGAGIPSYLVAIKPVWAERLFDSNLAALTLLPRELNLGLSREHVYYRSPNPGSFVEAPGRVLWYVSGGRPGHPHGELRAVSHLAEVITAPPDILHRRFSRLGAWTRQQVRDVADRKGRVMALRVVDTELFDRPLDLEAMRELCAEAGLTFRAPQSPIKIDDQMFHLLYRQSSAYVN